MNWIRICILVVLAACWATSSAAAYGLSGRRWPQANRGDPVALTYSYSNLLDGGLLNAAEEPLGQRQILTAIEEAFSVWADVAPLHFVEVPDPGGPPPTSNYPDGPFGTIRLGHRSLDGQGTFKGMAYYPPTPHSSACVICGDIHFDTDDRWETIGTLDLPDLLGAAIHEIGHSLGLAHTDIEGANMYPVFRRHTGPGSGWLHPDDIAGIHALYGAGSGSVTPLPRIPEPSSIMLIFIAAGTCWLYSSRDRLGWRQNDLGTE